MSFVTTQPEALTAAAGSLQGIGEAMTAQNLAAAAPTTGVVPAAADEVSALQATQFAAYGTLYQQLSAQAAALHEMFVKTLGGSADSYGAAEAVNAAAGGSSLATGDPSFGLGGVLSNGSILTAMQAGTIGSAASEFTGLGKGYITSPSGMTSGFRGAHHAALISETAPAGPAGPAAAPVSAGVGQASSIRGLSVPPSWAGAAASASTTAPATLTGAGWTTAAAPHNAPVTTMPAGMPAMASAGRGGLGFGTPRYGVKPTVMPRPATV